MDKPRYKVPAGSARYGLPVPAAPQQSPRAGYFQDNRSVILNGWRPALRESSDDIQRSWQDAAARATEAVQNSGFLTRIIQMEASSVMGPVLRFSSRPDYKALGWSADESQEFASAFESGFRSYANNPLEFDAGGKMNFGRSQRAAWASFKTVGEILALTPVINRPESLWATKVKMLPPSRLSQETDTTKRLRQGVFTDSWGLPTAYRLRPQDSLTVFQSNDYVDIRARDAEGRPNVLHIFDTQIGATRGISQMAPILKVVRQVEQYGDATLTAALIQTIFAATLKTNLTGDAAYAGMMTKEDALDLTALATSQADWYDAAKINLSQHGRIGHLFPGDELEFLESKQNSANFDGFMKWLMREIASGCGVTYEAATGDFSGATYSSIRMGGAYEWLGVLWNRQNIMVPYCDEVKNLWADEAIFTGRLKLPRGMNYFNFIAQKEQILRGSWAGPAQPQADDFKAARSHEVLAGLQATTMKDISEAYGRDWEDDMRQRAEENRLADELGLPRPWVPKDLMGTPEGQQAELDKAEMEAEPPPAPVQQPAGASKAPVEEPEPEGLNLGD